MRCASGQEFVLERLTLEKPRYCWLIHICHLGHNGVHSRRTWKNLIFDSESTAKLRGEEGTFQRLVTWFDNRFVISPGSSPLVNWKFLETYCQRHHPISNEELEELIIARGAKTLLHPDPAYPENCTMVQGVVWNPPSGPTNPLRLTGPDRRAPKAHDEEEGQDKAGEDEGQAVDDSPNLIEMFPTRKEAIHSYCDEGFRFWHAESELCHALYCTGRPLNVPCGPCPALAKVRRDVASKGQWYVDVVTPHTDECSHCTEFKVGGAWLLGGVREIINTEYFEHRKSPMKMTDTLQTKKQL